MHNPNKGFNGTLPSWTSSTVAECRKNLQKWNIWNTETYMS